MKKLVALVMVLGIASLATAGVSLVQVDAKTATFNVDPAASANNYLTIPSAVGYTMTLTDNAGGLSEIGATELYGDGLDWKFIVIASSTTKDTLSGAQVTVTLTGAETFAAGTGGLTLLDSSGYDTLASLAIVPEPATMALLGLGALVMRRKK